MYRNLVGLLFLFIRLSSTGSLFKLIFTMPAYDVVIVGASFAGLTLARHLPSTLRVLIVDAKPEAGSSVESTGLITERTREAFRSFLEIDRFITNPITSICVVAPNFDDYFVSTTKTREPWIYQTDTKALVKHMADTLPANVTLRMATAFMGAEGDPIRTVKILNQGKVEEIETRFLVGADGAMSKVASSVSGLDKNTCFLFGYEQVFFGDVLLGPDPAQTIYHFWFGEFSLGYGGWLSPTVVDGRKAFRIGLAKLMADRGEAKELMEKFLRILLDRKIVTVDGSIDAPGYVFGSLIPIGGTLKKIYKNNVLLLGNSAGFCGAFAADGIKGAIIAGKEAAKLIPRFLEGDQKALQQLLPAINKHDDLLGYYRKQVRYRMIWDMMKRDRTFTAMYRVIEAERDTFLDQFCDSKDKRQSLAWTVLKWKHVPKLVWYAGCLVRDLFVGR